MKKSAVLLVLFIYLFIPLSLSAQIAGYARMGLYTDASGATSTAFVDPYSPFSVYLLVQPGDNGITCTEYALEFDSDLFITGRVSHPDVTVELGDLTTGLSSCMDDCTENWILMQTITFVSSTSDPSSIRIVRHPDAGYHQIANCGSNRDIEPAFASPIVCVNQVCLPDEEPPAVTEVTVLSETEILLQLSERVFLPDASNLSNYLICRENNSSVTFPVLEVSLQGDDDLVWMSLGSSLGSEACVLRVSGLRDMEGNSIPSGTTVVFNQGDIIPPGLENVRAVDDSTLAVIFDEQVTPSSASAPGNYSVTVLLTGETVPVASVQLEPDGVTAVLYLGTDLERGVVHEVTAAWISDLSGNILPASAMSFMSIDDVPPLMSGVFVDAESYVRVVYNEAMDPVSSGAIGNYALFRSGDPSSVSTIDAATAGDDSSIVLHLTEELESEILYSLAVIGVMDSSMNVIEPDTFELSYSDTIPPLFLSAIPIDGNTIELVFNEALDIDPATSAANYRLYAESAPSVMLPIDYVELMPGASSVSLHLGEEMVLRSMYTVVIISLADQYGNIMQAEQSGHFIYIERVLPLVTAVTVKAPELLRVEFSEPLEDDSACDPDNYVIFEEGDTTARVNVVSADQNYASGTITLGTDRPFSDNIFYELRVSGIRDLARNVIDPDTTYVFFGRDAGQPELEGYLLENENIVILTFDEAMDPVSIGDPSLYLLFRSGEPSSELEIETVSIQGDRSVRIEIAEPPVPQQIYTLQIFGVMDAAMNVVIPITIDIIFMDDIPPELTGAAPLSAQAVRLEFSEVLHPVSAAAVGNYSVYPVGYPDMGVPIVTAERSEGGSVVILHLGGVLENGRTYRVDVTGIVDMFGNVISGTQTATIFIEDDEPPYVTGVTVEHMLKLSATFSEPLSRAGAENASNYTFFLAADTSAAFGVDEASITSGLMVVSLNPLQPLVPGAAYLLRVSGVSDLAGNMVVTDALCEFIAADDASPELVGYVTSGDSVITLTFSEPLEPASVAEPGNITIIDSRDHFVNLAIYTIELAGEGNVVTLVLGDHAVVGVPYLLDISGIEDLAGNPVVPVQEECIFSGGIDDSPRAVLAEATGNNEVVVFFDKQLEESSAEIDSNYYLYQAAEPMTRRFVVSAQLLADGSSVELTLEKGMIDNVYFTIVINGVQDIYGNIVEQSSEIGFNYVDQYLPEFKAAYSYYRSDRQIKVIFDEIVDPASSTEPDNYTICLKDYPDSQVAVDNIQYLGSSVLIKTAESLSYYPWAYPSFTPAGVDSLAAGEGREMLTCYLTYYTIEGRSIEDAAGHVLQPESTVELRFKDIFSPEMLSIRVLSETSIYLSFNEMVAQYSASDPGQYFVSEAGQAGPVVDVESVDYLGRYVMLELAGPLPAGEYEMRIVGLTDYAGNALADSVMSFTSTGGPAGAVIGVYVDGQRSGGQLNVAGPDEIFSYYVWCRGGDNGISAVKYAIRESQRYHVTNITTNETVVASESGYPVTLGSVVQLDGCHDGWVWTHRIDCTAITAGEEFVTAIPIYGMEELEISNCLYGNPRESAAVGDSIYLFIGSPLATLLEQWNVEYRQGAIELTWSIVATGEVPGFKVMRAAEGVEDFVELPSSLIKSDWLDFMVSDTGFRYGDSYRYRVTMSENGGDVILFETDAISTPELPLTLRQNVPNPFNPSTGIFYHLPERCAVSLDVYDVAGRHIVRLVSGAQAAGDHSVTWNGTDSKGRQVGSGVYFYALRAGKYELTKKMILLR